MSDENVNGNTVVRFTVKELLEDIRQSVRGLDQKLDQTVERLGKDMQSKVDQRDFMTVVTRLSKTEDDVRDLKVKHEQREKDQTSSIEHRRWFVPLVISVSTSVVSPFLWVVVGHIFK